MIETKFKPTEIGLIPEDWTIKQLGKVCEVHGRIGFRGYTTQDLVGAGHGALAIGGKHISKNYLDLSSPDYISWEKYYESPEIMVNKGDIVLAQRGTLGKSAIIDREIGFATINPSLVLLNNIRCNNMFLRYVLQGKVILDIIMQSNGLTSIPMISQRQIEGFPIIYPKEHEQQRIASALTSIDNLLSSLDKLIAKKRDIKQGAMQQLLTGKTRLKGFTEPWVYYSVGSDCCVKARIGWQGLTTSEYLEHGEYGLITSTDIVNYKVDWQTCCFVSEYRYAQDPNIIVQNGDVLISKDGTIGKVGIVSNIPFPCTLNSGVFVIRSKSPQISQEGLGLVFLSPYFADFIKRLTAGSTIVHLYQKDIVNFTFPMPPTIKEQQAIAAVLSSMDNEIAALEAKRKKYEAVKQGMMQQLLTGKIRLINQ
jgi:type I restriction enzyme S subunit